MTLSELEEKRDLLLAENEELDGDIAIAEEKYRIVSEDALEMKMRRIVQEERGDWLTFQMKNGL